MSDNIIPLRRDHIEKLLKPVNKLTDSCVIKSDSEGIFTVCSAPDSTVILYAKLKLDSIPTDPIRLNLISIKKLLNGLLSFSKDEQFSMEYNENYIKCIFKSDDTNAFFKYHLVDDSIIRECPINLKTLSAMQFDTEFVISFAKIKQILAGYSFASDVNKLYFYTEEKQVFAEINDRTSQNLDTMNLKICDEFSGVDIVSPIPINIEVFKSLINSRGDMRVKLNNKHKVFIFQNKDDSDVDLKYIVSALVK